MVFLKEATNKDIKFICNICISTDEIYSGIMPNSFIKQAKRYEKNGIPSDYKMYIVNNDKEKIGFLGITLLNEKIAYLVALYIDKDFYRLRYGQNTIDILFKELKKRNIKEVVLQVHKDATWAINFYKKNGFKNRYSFPEDMKLKFINDTILMSKYIL